MKKNEKIDFVVLWVDPSDLEWQKNRREYQKEAKTSESIDNNEERYRDWGLFKYWFRSIEKNAPWVNKVYLVTCGHVPEWLNLECPRLKIVKHSDIMPEDALPTFNSNAIELCVHRIPGLSNQFVLFNDDMFITKPVKPTDFFKDGLPLNTMALFSITPSPSGQNFYKVVANNVSIINKHFVFARSRKEFLTKYLSLKQREWVVFTYPLLIYKQFAGFRNYHIPISYLKKTFEEVWDQEEGLLNKTVHCRFRDNERNVSHWLFNYWQFASGRFIQRNAHFGKSIMINDTKIAKRISENKYRVICINDTILDGDIQAIRESLTRLFEKRLPEKCSFEV